MCSPGDGQTKAIECESVGLSFCYHFLIYFMAGSGNLQEAVLEKPPGHRPRRPGPLNEFLANKLCLRWLHQMSRQYFQNETQRATHGRGSTSCALDNAYADASVKVVGHFHTMNCPLDQVRVKLLFSVNSPRPLRAMKSTDSTSNQQKIMNG